MSLWSRQFPQSKSDPCNVWMGSEVELWQLIQPLHDGEHSWIVVSEKKWMKMMLMTDFWPLHHLRLYSAMRELVERRSSNCVRYHLPADCRAEAQIRDYWVHNPFQLLRQLHHPHTRYTLLLPPDCLPDLFMPQWMRIFAINLLSVHTKSDIFCGVWRGKEDYIRVYYV